MPRDGQSPPSASRGQSHISRGREARSSPGNRPPRRDCFENGLYRLDLVVRGLHPALDSAAVQALSRWRFSPARIGGEPVLVSIRAEMSFTLK